MGLLHMITYMTSLDFLTIIVYLLYFIILNTDENIHIDRCWHYILS